jgi:hypothetical protein
VNDGSRLAARGLRHGERLDVEAADELLVAMPLGVGLDVALVPGEAERRVRDLDSTGPSEVIVTSPRASGRQLPFSTAADRTISK